MIDAHGLHLGTSGTSAPVQSGHGGDHHLNTLKEIRGTRRKALKYLLAFACSLPLLPARIGLCAEKKSLVVFFSWGGNTRKVAEMIAKETGASLLELTTVQPYPSGYSEVGAVARREWQENARPKLATTLPADFAKCLVIFLGYPVWNHTMPMPVYTFLESNNLSGKLIAPFSTHMGDGLADGPEQIARLCPGAKVVTGLAISGTDVGHCQEEIRKWLQSNSLL